jgi:hypothetical protein
MTSAQTRALKWLADQGGHARMDQWGRAVSTRGQRDSAAAATWFRLAMRGFVAPSTIAGHFGITVAGVAALNREMAL